MREELKIKLWSRSMIIFRKYWGCHQLPSRSFFICSYQFPLCARCMGILLGELIAIIMAADNIIFPFRYNLLLLMSMVMDGSIQLITSYESNNIKRIISGFLFGFGIVGVLFELIVRMWKYVL